MKQTECIITAGSDRAIFVTFTDEGSRDPTPEEVREYLTLYGYWGPHAEVHPFSELSLVMRAAKKILGDEVY